MESSVAAHEHTNDLAYALRASVGWILLVVAMTTFIWIYAIDGNFYKFLGWYLIISCVFWTQHVFWTKGVSVVSNDGINAVSLAVATFLCWVLLVPYGDQRIRIVWLPLDRYKEE